MRAKKRKANHQKFVLITGSSRGIGYAFVQQFLKRGYSIVACSRQTDNVQKLQKNYPDQTIKTFNLDLTDSANCHKLFKLCQGLNIAIVVNNAGMMVYGQFGTKVSHEKEIALNVQGLHTLNMLFYPVMVKAKQGIIINIASTIAFIASPYFVNYQASKSFVLNLSVSLNYEARLLKSHVKVFAVCPGLTKTALIDNSPFNYSKWAMAPDRCVKIALRHALARFRKRPVIITGISNWLLARILIHLIPTSLKLYLIKKLYGKPVHAFSNKSNTN